MYPGFKERIHQGLVDVFGDKGKYVAFFYIHRPGTDHGPNARNIVTHHAEDGSGLGSAIIAGEFAYRTIEDECSLTA